MGFQYRDTESYGVMRLPVEMSMLEDESYRSSMAWYSEHGAEDKVYALDFARAYSKVLECTFPRLSLMQRTTTMKLATRAQILCTFPRWSTNSTSCKMEPGLGLQPVSH